MKSSACFLKRTVAMASRWPLVVLAAGLVAAAADAGAASRVPRSVKPKAKAASPPPAAASSASVALVAPPPPSPPSSPPPAPSATTEPPRPDPQEAPRELEPTLRARRITLTLNPLAVAVGRYGANVELLLAPHHGVTGSAFLQTFPRGLTSTLAPSIETDNPPPMVGGEVGYRFYSGRATPSGLFVGPSFVAMPLAYPQVGSDLEPRLAGFMAYGAAIDVGAQLVTSSGFTVGGGLGAMALAYTKPESIKPPDGTSVPSYPEPHVLPRVLLVAGWSF